MKKEISKHDLNVIIGDALSETIDLEVLENPDNEIWFERINDVIEYILNNILDIEVNTMQHTAEIEIILRVVAKHFGIAPETILIRNRCNQLCNARKLVYLMCTHLLNMSISQTARNFRYHHSTILYALKEYEDFRRFRSSKDLQEVPYYYRNMYLNASNIMDEVERLINERNM